MSQRNVPRHCSRAKTAQTRSINHNSPSPKKMARITQSKILAISSNPETIMLLLIVGELWDPEVPWQMPVAVFAPASGADFDFNTLLHHVINAEHDDNLEDYAIEPIVLDSLLTLPNPPGSLPAPLPHFLPPSKPTPPLSTSAATPGPSRHAPPKPGTNKLAY